MSYNTIDIRGIRRAFCLRMMALLFVLAVIHGIIYWFVIQFCGLSAYVLEEYIGSPITFISIYYFIYFFNRCCGDKLDLPSLVFVDYEILFGSLIYMNFFVPMVLWYVWDLVAEHLVVLVFFFVFGGLIDFAFFPLFRVSIRKVLSEHSVRGVPLYDFLWAFKCIQSYVKGDGPIKSIYMLIPAFPRISKTLAKLSGNLHDLFYSFVLDIDPQGILFKIDYSGLERRLFLFCVFGWVKISISVILGIVFVKNIDISLSYPLLIFIFVLTTILVALFVTFAILVPMVIWLGDLIFRATLGDDPYETIGALMGLHDTMGSAVGVPVLIVATLISIIYIMIFALIVFLLYSSDGSRYKTKFEGIIKKFLRRYGIREISIKKGSLEKLEAVYKELENIMESIESQPTNA